MERVAAETSVVNTATEVERQSWCHSCMRMVSSGEDAGGCSCGDHGDVWWCSNIVPGCMLDRNELEEGYTLMKSVQMHGHTEIPRGSSTGDFVLDPLKGIVAGRDGVNRAMMMAGVVRESQYVRFSSC